MSLLRLLTARRTSWVVVVLGLLAAGALIGAVGQAEQPVGPLVSAARGADSTEGTALQQRLPEADGSVAVVVATAPGDGTLPPAATRRIAAAVADAAGPGVLGDDSEERLQVLGPPVQPSKDGTAALTVLQVPDLGNEANAEAIDRLRDRLDTAAPQDVRFQVTGPAAVQADLASVFDGATFRLLAVTGAVVALLLLITYRSPVLWLVPLTVVGVADQLAGVLATRFLAAIDVPWDESTIGILSVLVFGAGTDYALLLISRYRDELHVHEDRGEAMAAALRPTLRAVVPSAVTVVIGLVTLALSVFPTTRGLGLACAVGVLTAGVMVMAVLPGALVLVGRWAFWPRIPHYDGRAPSHDRSLWARVGHGVARRPVAMAATLVVVLLGVALGTLRLDSGLSTADQFLDTPESITAADRVAQSFPAGLVDPLAVVTEADPDEVAAAAGRVDGVESARVGARGDGVAQVDVVLDGSGSTASRIESLRSALSSYDGTHVTGTEAVALDEEKGSERDRGLIIPLILGLVVVGLALLLRSVVAPLLLVLSVVLTYFASLGLAGFLFGPVLGFEAMSSNVPLLAFLFLVALGVDYNIFLVTRALEETPGHGLRDGMVRALASTGGVITSAGVLLAAVFAALGVLPLVVLAQLGVIICIGVLIDTLLVRTVLVPALAIWLGDRFWWPRRVDAGGA
ncbi:MMPL family transporter [Nocardioides marmoribigeumensis]|uniref:RND superfamily putative drug exporter n=1 Tax=Nocardioides marmoribigeumensis TaxID=433649 RepID=A0ABU2BUF0_9ACTN|nr:MMPL family transporter [Nocardioides marmoribigeumensis]MDR7362255.1 RND superfamily putative drug exporter [Nocardioides marmoribigeumensis]